MVKDQSVCDQLQTVIVSIILKDNGKTDECLQESGSVLLTAVSFSEQFSNIH